MTPADQSRADALAIRMSVRTVANVYLTRLAAWGVRRGDALGAAAVTYATSTAQRLSAELHADANEHARLFQRNRPFQPRVVASK